MGLRVCKVDHKVINFLFLVYFISFKLSEVPVYCVCIAAMYALSVEAEFENSYLCSAFDFCHNFIRNVECNVECS